jgi:GNAT superfamily N-acetyltransferase
MRIRLAEADDLAEVRAVEVAAGSMFAAIGLRSEALNTPPELDELREYVLLERLWVAVDEQNRPVAHAAMAIVDGHAHLEQVSVDPSVSRRGIGRELIEHVSMWAREGGLYTMTLTTFAEVPWNAPYYERLGFRRMLEAEWTPGLRAIREREIAAGLDEWPRVCMTRAL